MTGTGMGRRAFLEGAAGAMVGCAASWGALQPSAGASQPQPRGEFPIVAISSANGQRATQRAYDMMVRGADPLDAVIAGVALVEEDPNDTSVGYGGLPNEQGVVQLDAAVMHGPTHRAGAVAALEGVRHPAQVARKVMEESDHVLLVGPGAQAFARAHGFPIEELLTDKARRIWLYWKQTLSDKDDWLPPASRPADPDVMEFFRQHTVLVAGRRRFLRPTGTIHCSAMNARGDISCVTTTSGLAFKIPGRVGDSPIVGAGLYVDNDIGSCGSTGRGEANLQNLSSFAAVELMRQGLSPEEAGMEVLRRVASHTRRKDLLNERGEPIFDLKFYLLDKSGRHAGVSMYGPARYAVTDRNGTRLEECKYLYRRR